MKKSTVKKNEKCQFPARISADLMQRVRDHSETTGVPMNTVFTRALELYLIRPDVNQITEQHSALLEGTKK